jgi:hypothetical protein
MFQSRRRLSFLWHVAVASQRSRRRATGTAQGSAAATLMHMRVVVDVSVTRALLRGDGWQI